MNPTGPQMKHPPYRPRLRGWALGWGGVLGAIALAALAAVPASPMAILLFGGAWLVLPPLVFYGLPSDEAARRALATFLATVIGVLLALAAPDTAGWTISIGVGLGVAFLGGCAYLWGRRDERSAQSEASAAAARAKIILPP